MIKINDHEIDIKGKFLKLANIKDDYWIAGNPVKNMKEFISNLKQSRNRIDIFTFCQKPPDIVPKYNYYMEWDNLAVIPITNYDEWWTKRLPHNTRKNVRRAYKKGLTVKVVELDDELIKGMTTIYNESSIRQGRAYLHYGKDFNTIKKEISTYLTNSDFICAYHNDELIGFIKLVYVGHIAQIMQIISKIKHQDKRPTNALIAKAVEICVEKKMDYFVYGQYVYGNKTESTIIDFKVRNGFEMMKLPRYYIPISPLGEIGIKLKIHKGIKNLIPENLLYFLIDFRTKWYSKRYSEKKNEL